MIIWQQVPHVNKAIFYLKHCWKYHQFSWNCALLRTGVRIINSLVGTVVYFERFRGGMLMAKLSCLGGGPVDTPTILLILSYTSFVFDLLSCSVGGHKTWWKIIKVQVLCILKFFLIFKTKKKTHTQKEKAGPHDQHVRVFGLHQNRPAYLSKLKRFSNRSNDPSYWPA